MPEELKPVAPGVSCLKILFVNLYVVGEAGGPWVLVDAGLPRSSGRIRRAAAKRYGPAARPAAIILTHGHFDHSGSPLALATEWDVPVYAHRLEMPYLTGKSDYPPQDPTVGGAIALLSRVFPHSGTDLGHRIHALPDDGSVPGIRGWRYLHTPGHTAGQIALFRDADRVLLAADALTTVNQDSPLTLLKRKPEFYRPRAPFTTDWAAARQSIERMADLEPFTVAAGHGSPMTGPHVAGELRRFAAQFVPPRKGRYAARPAIADERGIVALPPCVPDPLPKFVAGAALATLAGTAIVRQRRRKASP